MKPKINDGRKLISIVIPVFNEESNLREIHRRLTKVMKSMNFGYEIIFVDDGSTDTTGEILREINKGDANTLFLRFSRNFGHQIAITAGMENAHGDAVVVMDADLQHPPEIIPELVDKWIQGFEIVSTIREDVKEVGFLKNPPLRFFTELSIRFRILIFKKTQLISG